MQFTQQQALNRLFAGQDVDRSGGGFPRGEHLTDRLVRGRTPGRRRFGEIEQAAARGGRKKAHLFGDELRTARTFIARQIGTSPHTNDGDAIACLFGVEIWA